jgi:hypothetical protein
VGYVTGDEPVSELLLVVSVADVFWLAVFVVFAAWMVLLGARR